MSALRNFYLRAWRHRQPIDRIATVVLVAIVVGGAIVVLTAGDDEQPTRSIPAGAATSTANAKPCKDVDLTGTLTERATCKSRTAVLSFAPQSKPLLLPGTQVRVSQARLGLATMSVRMRVRNEDGTAHRLAPASKQFYLNVDGRRLYAGQLQPGADLQPQTAATVTATFPVAPAQRSRLSRQRTVDLGVVPFGQIGQSQPSQLGIVRLRVTA